MKTTNNYGLKKPEGTDVVNIEDLNFNVDTLDKKIKEVEMDITDLKNHVDNGKSSLYSAIVGKKVTPRSKDFADLKSAIDGIKLGQGNAQASEVLSGKTFTNDSGGVQKGSMPSYGNKVITPNRNNQHLSNGYYQGIDVSPITNEVIKNNFDENAIKELLKKHYPNISTLNYKRATIYPINEFGYNKNYTKIIDVGFVPKVIVLNAFGNNANQPSDYRPSDRFLKDFDLDILIDNNNFKNMATGCHIRQNEKHTDDRQGYVNYFDIQWNCFQSSKYKYENISLQKQVDFLFIG